MALERNTRVTVSDPWYEGPGRGARVPAYRAAAPAKINLYLHVTGRRADGLHLLDSLVVFAAVHDTVSARAAARLTLTVDGPFGPALGGGTGNLVERAARALASHAGVEQGAALNLTKRLPVAAGLGGGSSDAAATLGLLTRLWQLTLAPAAARAIGLALGADVPVCQHGRAAFMAGIGERIEPIEGLPPAHLVLANPGRPLATRAVFGARAGPYSAAARFAPARAPDAFAAQLAARRNDLTDAALGLCPEIGAVLDALAATPGCRLARMSGSGPSCFGLYDDAEAAARAAAALGRAHPAWWVVDGAMIADIATLIP